MVERNIIDRLKAIQLAPFAMRQSLVWPVKIALDVLLIKGVIDGSLIHPLDSVVVVTEGHIKAGVSDVFLVEGMANNVPSINCLPNLCIAINAQVVRLQDLVLL